jgi:hypothetical protein
LICHGFGAKTRYPGSMSDRWERLNKGATIITYLQAFGWWDKLLPWAAGAVTWALTAIAKLPGWAIALVVLTAMLIAQLTLWLRASTTRRQQQLLGPPEYGRWDHVEEFPAWEAAALWVGLPATTPSLDEAGLAVFRLVKEKLREGNITAVSLEGSSPNRRTIVSRAELVKLALYVNDKTPFLFPESRA